MYRNIVPFLIALFVGSGWGGLSPGFLWPGHSGGLAGTLDQRQASDRWAERLANQDFNREPTQAVCGIYATCRALQIEGIEADPRDYLTSDFVSQAAGSSPEDLIRLVESAGGKGWPLEHLGKFELLCLGKPVVANVRSNLVSPGYDHWVCVYPTGGELLVFDGPNSPTRESAAEFLPLWSGYGIVVTRPDVTLQPWMVGLPRFGVWLVVGAVGLFVFWRRNPATLPRWRYWLSIFACALLVMLVGRIAFAPWARWNRAIRFAIAPYAAETQFPLASMDEMIRAGQSPDEVLICAQPTDAYEQGHYPGALNLPFDLPIWRLADVLQGLNPNDPIITYCWSEGCEWDRILANKLSSLGFRNIRTGAVGYLEYLNAQSDSPKPTVDAKPTNPGNTDNSETR